MSRTLSLIQAPSPALRRAIVALAVLALCVAGLAIVTGSSSPASAATSRYAKFDKLMAKRINAVRAAEHLAPLKFDARLTAVATSHSRLMSKHGKWRTRFAGEVRPAAQLAARRYYSKSVHESLGHVRTGKSLLRRLPKLAKTMWPSLLKEPMTTVGVGVVRDKHAHRYWVTVLVAQKGRPTQSQLGSSYANNLLGMLNDERAANGLPALTMNAKLIQSAHTHNLDMARQNEMSHQLAGEAFFADRIEAAGYNYQYAGENIGWNSVQTLDGVRQLEQIMYDEKPPGETGHRENILSKNYTNVGIDVYFDNVNGKVWLTEDFGKPAYW
jgi:uncharacterized protein YkwD